MPADILDVCTLSDLMHRNARKLKSAEKQLEEILPEWIEHTTSASLLLILNTYLRFVRENSIILQKYLSEEGLTSLSCTNRTMQDIILESREVLSNCTNEYIKDAGLLSAIQIINHYKIALYGTLAAYADATGNIGLAHSFHHAKMNEAGIDQDLSRIATTIVNKSVLEVQAKSIHNDTKS